QVVAAQFAHYLVRCTAFQEEFFRWGHGIVDDLWTTRYSSARKIMLAIPTVPEQHAIARYLDRETAKIDTLIAGQERLVDLLIERRGSQIAATLGGGPPAPGTASARAMPSAGQSRWQTVRCRYLCRITTGTEDS